MLIKNSTYHAVVSVILFLLCVSLLSSNFAYAALHPDDTEANALKELGIFLGSENGFELDKKPTRVEVAVILLRILGKESAAIEKNLPNKFDDVPAWASAQIEYLYDNGIVMGISDTHFGNGPIDFNQVMTMILRAMGYNDGAGDFTWSSAASKAKELSVITPWRYDVITASSDFTRKDLVSCIYCALQAPMKSKNVTLIRQLLYDSVISEDQVKNTGTNDLLIAANLLQRNCKHCYFNQEFTITPVKSDLSSSCTIKVNLPDNYYNRQKVIGYTFSTPPTSYYYDDGGLYAVFTLNNVNQEQVTVIKITTELELYRYDLETAEALHFPVNLSDEDAKKYTSATYWIESDDPTFKKADIGVINGTEIQKIEAIERYVSQHMKIQITDIDSTALNAFNQGYGDCFEYSVVFAALCRANGIPARVIICDIAKESAPGHSVVEVFMTDLGWVPFDPVNTANGTQTLNSSNNYYKIYLSDNIHSVFLNGCDYYWIQWNGCYCSVKENVAW